MTPRHAIILAAGYGSRLTPLTHNLPKCLLPFWGRTILDRTLDQLADWGVRDVLVNLHHAPDPLWRHLCRQPNPRLRLACSYEPDILGTGGALRRAAWFLGDAPFWMINGDIVCRCDPRPLVRALAAPRTMAALLMTTAAGPRTVELEPSGRVRTFRSVHPGAPGTVTFCGLQLLRPAIVDYLADTPASTIVSAYEHAAAARWRIVGITQPHTEWADIGTPEGLLGAHANAHPARRPRLRGVTISGFASIAPDARIARGARLHNAIVLGGAAIGPHADVRDAIVGPLAQVNGTAHRLAVALPLAGSPEHDAIARTLGWSRAHTTLQPFAPRGSARTFSRLACDRRSAIVIRYGVERPENARFAGHARFLRKLGIPVPRILIDQPGACLVVTEDLGDHSLQDAARGASATTLRKLYAPVIAAVARWHRVAGTAARQQRLALEPAFGADVFHWEHALFATHYLHGRLELPNRQTAAALRELPRVAARLAAEPRTLVHRDLQSSNVLLRGARPAFIDFQGMRFGPAAYDLASLLSDPYVMLPPRVQRELLAAYARAAGVADDARFQQTFWFAVVQRLVQAIGAYGRLSRLPGTGAFVRHIPPALEMLDRALSHLYTLSTLRGFVAHLRQLEARRGSA